MYKSIHLNSKITTEYKFNKTENEIGNLAKINIFIGPNNTGKSRFLRDLFSNDNLEFKSTEIDILNFITEIKSLKASIESLLRNFNLDSFTSWDPTQFIDIGFFVQSESTKITNLLNYINMLSNINIEGASRIAGSMINPSELKSLSMEIRNRSRETINRISEISAFVKSDLNSQRIYIPTLRGLRGINFIEGRLLEYDSYLTRTKRDYFTDIPEFDSRIFSGLNLYTQVKKLLLGSMTDRELIRKFEKFIGSTFFKGKTFNIIPRESDNVVHVVIDNDEYPIYQLGEGIQSIIILTYPLFFNQGKNLKVFYEEPDLFLHPGFQRIFIETLLNPLFDNYQFFFTTHSNHFLDMTLDFNQISVYSFERNYDKSFMIENLENASYNLLELLGVRNSSVFLSNCTIWVEGISDRIYIRKYLEMVFKEKEITFHEDIHYSFVEYGGSNITHWSFLEATDKDTPNINVERLCGKLFLITDKDDPGFNKDSEPSKKLSRQKKLEEILKERYYCLKTREIENLLTSEILLSTVQFLELPKNKDKIEIKQNAEYGPNVKVGEFIDSAIIGTKKKYAEENGSLRNKSLFAREAIEFIKEYTDMSDEAKNLSELLFNFISDNNLKN